MGFLAILKRGVLRRLSKDTKSIPDPPSKPTDSYPPKLKPSKPELALATWELVHDQSGCALKRERVKARTKSEARAMFKKSHFLRSTVGGIYAGEVKRVPACYSVRRVKS